jgi:hypothetical protein
MKFKIYGVLIEQVNIMSTMLPIDLRHILKATTTCDVLLQQQVKYHEHRMLQLSHHESKTLLKLKRDNIEYLQKLKHDGDVEEI